MSFDTALINILPRHCGFSYEGRRTPASGSFALQSFAFGACLAFGTASASGSASHGLDVFDTAKAQGPPILVYGYLPNALEASIPDGIPAGIAVEFTLVSLGSALRVSWMLCLSASPRRYDSCN